MKKTSAMNARISAVLTLLLIAACIGSARYLTTGGVSKV